ncbi:MAG: triose-phosphate isomerase [Gammaproteobacteria bacterium]
MRKPLVAGNWKMNGTLASIKPLLQGITQNMPAVESVEVTVCPPFVYLPFVSDYLTGHTALRLGAQNLGHEAQGAFTGEVSAAMLADYGCRYVIIGHSERRQIFHESDELIALKFGLAVKEEITPILCVGETLQQREATKTEEVIRKQLLAVVSHMGGAVFQNALIAYEPVWAIGTGKTATPSQAQAVHIFIRELLAEHDEASAKRTRILYGGSVKASNAVDLFRMPDVDGGLIGGASLQGNEFLAICRAAASSEEKCY